MCGAIQIYDTYASAVSNLVSFQQCFLNSRFCAIAARCLLALKRLAVALAAALAGYVYMIFMCFKLKNTYNRVQITKAKHIFNRKFHGISPYIQYKLNIF